MPSTEVWVARVSPCCEFSRIIFASGTEAPEVSETVPLKVAVNAWDCALILGAKLQSAKERQIIRNKGEQQRRELRQVSNEQLGTIVTLLFKRTYHMIRWRSISLFLRYKPFLPKTELMIELVEFKSKNCVCRN